MTSVKSLLGGLVLLLALALPAGAQSLRTPEAVLRGLLSGAPVTADDFSPDFLAQVPLAQLQPVLDATRAELGPVTSVEMTGNSAHVASETATMEAKIGLDAEGRVAMLWFDLPAPKSMSLDAARAQLAALGERVAWLVRRDGVTIEARDADVPLAVASAFKLGVLSVLLDDIATGARRWDELLVLEARHKSLPTGLLQDFPDESPITLHTAAFLMISQSDNTATDLLIDSLGRERIAARLGLSRLITTRELFALKADPAAQTAYLAADDQDAARIAAQAALTRPDPAAAGGPFVPGVEWDIPLSRLCDLIEPMAGEAILRANPGPVPSGWASVAYKGGSEGGVLNFTTALTDADGTGYCVAMTVNGGATDMTASVAAFRSLLAAIRPGE